jgi:hypothetical protein
VTVVVVGAVSCVCRGCLCTVWQAAGLQCVWLIVRTCGTLAVN